MDGLDKGLNKRPILEIDAKAEKDAKIVVLLNTSDTITIIKIEVYIVVLNYR